jgi:hypothetical protein
MEWHTWKSIIDDKLNNSTMKKMKSLIDMPLWHEKSEDMQGSNEEM